MAAAVLLMLLLPFIHASSVTDGGTPGLPGVKLHLTEKGMRYLSYVAGEALNDLVHSHSNSIPNISRDFDKWWGSGTFTAQNILIVGFHTPTFLYENRPPDRFIWKSSGGFCQVTGQWRGRYETWYMRITKQGTFTSATLDRPHFQVSARFQKTSSGKLAATDIECHASMGRLSLDISGGGMSGSIMNFFSTTIAKYIRPALERELCHQAKRYVSLTMNSEIGEHPFTQAFFGERLLADFKLTRNFVMTPDSVESWHRGTAFYGERPDDLVPFYPHPLRRSGDESKMLYVLASDYFFNSVLYQVHKNNISRFETTEKTSKLAHYLRPACHIFCLGTIFPQLEQMYGRRAKGQFSVYSTQAPTVIFKPNNATVRVQGYVEVYAVQGVEKSKMFGVLGTVDADVQFEMANAEGVDPRFVYNLTIKSLKLEKLDSEIDAIKNGSEEIIEQFINFSIGFIEETLNEELANGIELMLAKGSRTKDARIRVLDRTIEIATDFVFYGDEGVYELPPDLG